MKSLYLKIFLLLFVVMISIIVLWYTGLEVPIFFVFAVFTVFIFIAGNIKYREINNPFTLYCIGWLIPLSLAQIKLSNIQRNYTSETWVLILTATMFFVIPCFIMLPMVKKKAIIKVKYNVERLYCPIIAIAFIAALSMLFNWYSIGGIPLIVGDNNASHLTSAKFINYFIYMAPPLSGLAILYLVLGGKKYRKIMYLIVMLPYMYAVLQMLRSLILSCIYYQAMYLYITLRIKGYDTSSVFKKIRIPIFVLLITLVVLMPVIGNYRVQSMYGDESVGNDFWVDNVNLKQKSSTLAWVYSYYCMGFDNLDLCINNYEGPLLYGYNTLVPITGPTQIKRLWTITPEDIDSQIPRTWGAAVGTYLRDLYIDGGIWFAILITFIYSFLVNYFYHRGTNGFIKLRYFAVYTGISYAIIYMFFNAGVLSSPPILINSLMVFYILGRYTYIENTK